MLFALKRAKKILTVEREEGFAIYENRVLLTLIHKALMFVDDKYSKIKENTGGETLRKVLRLAGRYFYA